LIQQGWQYGIDIDGFKNSDDYDSDNSQEDLIWYQGGFSFYSQADVLIVRQLELTAVEAAAAKKAREEVAAARRKVRVTGRYFPI
jgi:hypothetical protein